MLLIVFGNSSLYVSVDLISVVHFSVTAIDTLRSPLGLTCVRRQHHIGTSKPPAFVWFVFLNDRELM